MFNSLLIIYIFFLNTVSKKIIFCFKNKSGGNLEEFLKNKNGILAESEVILILNSLKSAFSEMY